MASVQLRGVCKTFGRNEVIRDVSVDIADGEFVVLVGPSGCGKSTLLRLIAGLEDITSGDMLIDGVRVNAWPPKERGVAMVFQSYALYPHMNAYENMAFGLRLAKSDTATVDQKVRRAAEMLELTPLLERLPRELSGGQRQRVAIGRAIVRDPRVFLFDEPLSNLDAALRVQTRIELSRLHQSTGATMVYVTHDQVEAMTLADTVVVLSEGRIEQVGPPLALYHAPANRFVAGFIGSPRMNFIDVRVRERTADTVSVELPGGVRVDVPAPGAGLGDGETLTLGVRPDHLSPQAPGAGLEGIVKVVEQLGESHLLHVQVPGAGLLTLREPGDASVAEGESIGMALRARSCHLFRGDGTALR